MIKRYTSEDSMHEDDPGHTGMSKCPVSQQWSATTESHIKLYVLFINNIENVCNDNSLC